MSLDLIYEYLIKEQLIGSVSSNKIKQVIYRNTKLKSLKLIDDNTITNNTNDNIQKENKFQLVYFLQKDIIDVATLLQNTITKYEWKIHSIGIFEYDTYGAQLIKLNSTISKLKQYLNNNMTKLLNSDISVLVLFTIKKQNTSIQIDKLNIDTKMLTNFAKNSKLNVNEPLNIKTFKIIYHLTPSKHIQNIKKIGLIPKSLKKRYDHPNSIHFSTDPYQLYELYKIFKRSHSDEDYYVIKIDTSKLRDNIYCYPYIDMGINKSKITAYYTYDNIPTSAFISILKMD